MFVLKNCTTPCPHCGREVTVPWDVDACFCAYCGGRVERPTLGAFQPGDVAECIGRLAETPLPRPDSRAGYEEGFQLCRTALEGPIAALEAGLDPALRAEQILQTASACLEALTARWPKAQPRYEDQHLVAVYLIPALRDLPQSCGDELARAIHRLWLERWPKSPIGLGDHSTIVEGYQKKLCFITTAVCRQRGRGDDCYELTAFRRFRDQALLPTEEGRALVEEYYRLAPAIVTAMELCQDTEAVCALLWRKYLTPCLRSIEAGDSRACREKYVEMVRYLERTCLPSYSTHQNS